MTGGEANGQAEVPCIPSVLTPTSHEHLQGPCRAGKHAPCAGLGSLAMQRAWYPAAGHLLLQSRKTFAKLLQLFNHINHSEGKALVSLKSHQDYHIAFHCYQGTDRKSERVREWVRESKKRRGRDAIVANELSSHSTHQSFRSMKPTWTVTKEIPTETLRIPAISCTNNSSNAPLALLTPSNKNSLSLYKLWKKQQCKNLQKAGIIDL